jgi:hypothetical protein
MSEITDRARVLAERIEVMLVDQGLKCSDIANEITYALQRERDDAGVKPICTICAHPRHTQEFLARAEKAEGGAKALWKDFGFFDEARRPYKVVMTRDGPRLCYWHPENKWVTLRQVSQNDIWSFTDHMTDTELSLYDRDSEKRNSLRPPSTEAKL